MAAVLTACQIFIPRNSILPSDEGRMTTGRNGAADSPLAVALSWEVTLFAIQATIGEKK